MAEKTNLIKETQDETTLGTNPPDFDELAPKAPPNEPSADGPAEAKNTGGGTPLHELLLRMAKDDEELTSEAGLDELNRLLDSGARVDAKDVDGQTALHLAAANGLVKAAMMLINAGANILEKDKRKRQPLLRACSEGHLDVVNLLLRQGAETRIREEDGWSPLHAASRNGHTEIIQTILDEDKENIDDTEWLENWTALNLAIYHGQGGAGLALLDKGANVSIQDNDGWTPLMTAIQLEHEDIVQMLLNQKGDLQLETRDKLGHTPLLAASINGFSAGVRLLVEKDADCNVHSTDSGCTPLIAASRWGHGDVIGVLLGDSRTNVNAQDKDTWTALHEASDKGNSEVVKILLQHQSDVDRPKRDKRTALHLASEKGNENIVEQLLKAKAKVDAKDWVGKTALHLASGAGPEDYSKQEDELGPDGLGPDEKGMMEFHSGQHATVVKLLLEHGARPDDMAYGRETALHLAAARGDPTRLDLILASMDQEHMSIRNDQGRTALYLACTGDGFDREKVVKSLLKSNKLRTAEFGRSDGEDDEIKWAANYPETHEVAKWLMEERWERKNTTRPEGSDNWSVIEWAAYSRLPEVLSLLITNSPSTLGIEEALVLALGWLETAKEWMKDRQVPVMLFLLIANSRRTSDIDDAIRSARTSATKLLERTKNQEHDPELAKGSKTEAGASSDKGKTNKHAAKAEPGRERATLQQIAPTTQAAKDPETVHLEAIVDILRDSPFSQTHKGRKIDRLPKYSPKLSSTLENFEATVVQFFQHRDESETLQRYRPLKEVIYDNGPRKMVQETISNMRILGDRSELVGAPRYQYLYNWYNFMWIHLPATNMVWMNDTFLRIMNDERCEASSYHELKSFFRDSWTQVPDGISPSRSMRPRTVVRRTKKDIEKEDEDGKPDFGAASATYMPYFCFSTYHQDAASLGKNQEKYVDMREAYRTLNDFTSSVIHESPTLDEWYYQFAPDEESMRDRKRRNATQIVTKAMKSTETTTEGDESPKEGEDDGPSKWTLVRVNQLWAWTIADKWLITATDDLFDISKGTLADRILEQLGKKAETSGSASQPESATDMSRLIIDYCIGSYERLPEPKSWQAKHQGQGSIRQIFSNAVNKIGREEATLFKEFSSQMARWREQVPIDPDKTSPGGSLDGRAAESSQASVYGHIRRAIEKIDLLFGEIKDIRDELNILKTAAQHQKTVEEGLGGGSLDANLAAAYVLNDLKGMDNSAEKIQSAINTTLSLLQSDSANLQAALSLEETKRSNHLADLAAQQAKTLMVFTVVTILFLPLSFLSSLFALDVASFQQAPGWAFAVIFGVSFAFSTITALVALRETIRAHLRNFMSQDDQSNKTKSESSEKSGDEAEGKDIVERGPGPRSEPATGNTDSHRQPFLSCLRGRLRRRQSDAV